MGVFCDRLTLGFGCQIGQNKGRNCKKEFSFLLVSLYRAWKYKSVIVLISRLLDLIPPARHPDLLRSRLSDRAQKTRQIPEATNSFVAHICKVSTTFFTTLLTTDKICLLSYSLGLNFFPLAQLVETIYKWAFLNLHFINCYAPKNLRPFFFHVYTQKRVHDSKYTH